MKARTRGLAAGVVAILVVLSVPGPVAAHGEFESAQPEPDSEVGRPPRTVAITLTEPPSPGTVVAVTDGCSRDLVTDIQNSDDVVRAALKKGQPGKWTVRFRAVSAVDGHTSRDSFAFKVTGKKDCSKPDRKEKSPDVQVEGGEDTQISSDDFPEDEGSSFPIVPFAIGSVVVIAGAVLLRRATK
ncbi:MAG TPA: copper resistance CopC family protein [Actinomycetota bacterium]|nr:copper resistance CopC family protein [Actinomycetota bacterium]